MQIKDRGELRLGLSLNSTYVFAQEDIWPLSTTLCFLSFSKSDKTFNKSLEIQSCLNLKMNPLGKTLSKALDMPKAFDKAKQTTNTY